MNRASALLLTGILIGAAAAVQAQAPVDADAAMALARRNDCFKCHSIDRAKKAPAYTRIAARLRSKPDAVEAIIEHITAGSAVQLLDGSDALHRIVDTRNKEELENLARWILSL